MKNVLITGASRGIGAAIAKKYIENNYNVAINAINNVGMLEDIIQEYAHINKNIIAVKADVSDYDQVKSMFNKIEESFGKVDILINNAGISQINLFHETSPCDFKKMVDTNLVSMFNTSHIAIPHMIKNQLGTIINISSIWGSVGASCEVIYSATKGGVNAFTKALAKELAPSGINVNAIACGIIDTDMNAFLQKDERFVLEEQIPIGKLGTPTDIADVCYFLSSGSAKYITGQIITVDGGFI